MKPENLSEIGKKEIISKCLFSFFILIEMSVWCLYFKKMSQDILVIKYDIFVLIYSLFV